MFQGQWKRVGTLVLAAALALAGCTGDKGDTGPQGDAGNDGSPGTSVGSITGTIRDSGGLPFQGATVTTSPLALASAPTGADGAFTLSNVPLGTYSLAISGTGIAAVTVPNVIVVAGTATNVGTKTVAFSPLTISFPALPVPAGFDTAVPLSATVAGATGPVTYKWSVVSGPTAGSFSDTTAAAPSFTTGTLEAMIAAGKLRNLTAAPARNGLLAFTAQHVTNSTYSIKLEVSDGHYTQSKTVSLVTAVVSAGQLVGAVASVPRNVMVLANTGTVETGGWTLTKPPTATAASDLHDASTKNPWFVPDVLGDYVLKNGATTVATIGVSDWHGAPDAGCGTCHAPNSAADLATQAKFKAWNNSAHGNHFFKYFEYAGDALVPKGDPTATSVVVPTVTPGVSWTLTAPFRPITTFEFGMTGGEGGHYSESCMRCHTVGMNKAPGVVNGGIDDVAGYAFPSLGADSDPALPAPDLTKWNAFPAAVRARAGMQCESCHGPLGKHLSLASAPRGFFDSGTCGVCHDSGSNHNRFNLWAQSRHANLVLAEEEGTSTNCGRCHSAQGFVAWSKAGFDRNTNLAAAPSASDIEPVTCIACHDPHTTTLRVDESQPVTTTSGFTVSGAGVGQLCVICHSSRRGVHNDAAPANTSYSLPHAAAQSDLFFGQNVYFFGALDDGSTISTHAFVLEGTCGGCHLDKGLANEGLNMVPSVTNHSFKVSSDLCAKCHGSSFAALKENTERGIDGLKAAIAGAGKRMLPSAGFKLTGVAAVINGTAFTGKATFASKPDVVTLGLPGGAHGTGLTFHWNAPVSATFTLADNAAIPGGADATVTLGDATSGATVGAPVSATGITTLAGAPVISASSDLFKAWWNLALIEEERSFGAHNPSFAGRVLAVSTAKAVAIPAAP
jgi:Carboxypeptidase regulatory-like domain